MKHLFFSLIAGVIIFCQPVVIARATFVIEGSVPEQGQGSSPRNIASDKTLQYEQKYGAHDPRDQVTSDLMLYLAEGTISLLFLILFFEFSKAKKIYNH